MDLHHFKRCKKKPWPADPNAPVPGVVAGSNLEQQIKSAGRAIDAWPADVKAAMAIDEEDDSNG